MLDTNKIPQNNSANQDLFIDLNDEKAEKISGGKIEVFSLKNSTSLDLNYMIDGKKHRLGASNSIIWATDKGGEISFDFDLTSGYSVRKYDLSHRQKYEFQLDLSTSEYDVDVYNTGWLSAMTA